MMNVWQKRILLAGWLFGTGPLFAEIEFNRDIRPILSDHCFACHGFDEHERKADLRLDTREGATANLEGTRAIVPGDLEKSEMWHRVLSEDEDEVMPPPEHHKPLSAAQKETLKKWIESGAEYQEHWSFVAPSRPEVPVVAGVKNPIDAFLQKRLEEESLRPAKVASKEMLIRRVTLDLTGLPPTPQEVDAFVADEKPDAYNRLIEKLMTRITYGEHMGRHWLDLARYADTHGLHLDNERSMWPYRDWVVRAFHENLPFDEFTRWQLAGDLLPEPTQDQLIASGFNRCNVTTGEGGSIAKEWVYRYAVERTATTAEVWMGLTAGCSQCHDHKFDPISTKEFYEMYAFFHSAADPAMDGNKIDTPPILKLTTEEDGKRLADLDTKIAKVEKRINQALLEMDYQDPALADPQPGEQVTEDLWFEDSFPEKSKLSVTGSAPLQFVTKVDGEVFSGEKAVRRKAGAEVAQDVAQGGMNFVVPAHGKIFASCFLDPADPPETIMLQFHTNGWNHRAVWGAHSKIDWGDLGKPSKKHLGPLPKAGEWVTLEVDAAAIGLKAGTKVNGYAFTQYGGTVTWDKLGVSSSVNPVTDPSWSWSAWKNAKQGKNVPELREELRFYVRGTQIKDWAPEKEAELKQFWLRHFHVGSKPVIDPYEKEMVPFREEKEKIEKEAPITFVMADLPKARESFVMVRGQYDNEGEQVHRATPAFLPPLLKKAENPAEGDPAQVNRLDLANWLVREDHPLTARVTVNRFWQQFFGIGLVRTSEDFGSQGEPPVHPELLDWLAVQFIEDGWDIQKLVTRIVTSHAYRQDPTVDTTLLDKDPENRLLARGPRLRLDAEVIRDQALFTSGLLVDTVGGKGVRPYQPENIWEPVGFGRSNTRYYKRDTGDALYRRSLYTFLKRTAPPPFMATFDAPNRESACSRRSRSNTPLQALQLMNDIQHVEAARNLAQRMLNEGGETDETRIHWAWKTVTSRAPNPEEIKIVQKALKAHRQRFANDEDSAGKLISYGESQPDEKLSSIELAAHTLVANLILNLDETVNH